MRADELYTRHVAMVRTADKLLDAARRMREEHVGALVVVRGSGDGCVPIGILTDRDVVVAVLAKTPEHVASLDVGDVMTPSSKLVTAFCDEDVVDILRRMRHAGIRRVPVVDGRGMLEGVLSVDDILVGLSRELAEAAQLLSHQRALEPARRPEV